MLLLLRYDAPDGSATAERPIVVSRYEAPRLKKKLEFVRKAYGAGDVVSATFELKRPTGEPMKGQVLTAVIRLDGVELPRVTATTNSEGGAMIKVPLPAIIELGDGLLTVLVDDGGITESVSKAVPIVMRRMQLSFYPEGGKLVTGLESRVYFEAKTALGKPADVEGNVVDDQGQLVAQLAAVATRLRSPSPRASSIACSCPSVSTTAACCGPTTTSTANAPPSWPGSLALRTRRSL